MAFIRDDNRILKRKCPPHWKKQGRLTGRSKNIAGRWRRESLSLEDEEYNLNDSYSLLNISLKEMIYWDRSMNKFCRVRNHLS
jgi:hypothetical protein